MQNLKRAWDTSLYRYREQEQVVFILAEGGVGTNSFPLHFKEKTRGGVRIWNFKILNHLELKPANVIAVISAFAPCSHIASHCIVIPCSHQIYQHPAMGSFHSVKYNCFTFTPLTKKKVHQILLIVPSARPHKCTVALQRAWMLTFDIPQREVSIAGNEGEEEAMSWLGLVSVHRTNGVNQLRRINQEKRFRFQWHK